MSVRQAVCRVSLALRVLRGQSNNLLSRNFDGGSMGENGRVHPHYRNTLYVEYEQRKHPDGSMRYVLLTLLGLQQYSGLPVPDRFLLYGQLLFPHLHTCLT